MIGSARTRVFAIIGDPVSHSLSPQMQNAAFRVLGLDAVYVALRTPEAGVRQLMGALAGNEGGGNVTVPHKQTAAGVVDEMRGPLPTACNTFWREAGRLIGDNTDVGGILHALGTLGATGPEAGPWLVIGTGGSALAAAAAAREAGAGLAVRSRDPERAVTFLENSGARFKAEISDCRVVINCTPPSVGGELPVSPEQVPGARWALDLVYAAGETGWVRAMRAAGSRAADGREVLLRQGAAALERWFPGRRAPIEVMRAAIRDALG